MLDTNSDPDDGPSDGPSDDAPARIPSGIDGLDAVLHGGFPRDGLHLLTGPAGSGKTTLALQFLVRGARDGEEVLYLTLSQSERDLRQIARSHGLPLDGVRIQELAQIDVDSMGATEQTLFHMSEVELGETMAAFLGAVERLEPKRIAFDSIAELRLLAGDEMRYRTQMLALRQHLARRECTTLLLQPDHARQEQDHIQDLVRGVMEMQPRTSPYGDIRRWLQVAKMRGATFQGGRHDLTIRTGGVEVFPRLRIQTQEQQGQEEEETGGPEIMPSGIGNLDRVLGGGLQAGTSCLIVGPAGTGKSSLAAAFAHAAAERGERAAIFLFEERPETFLRRSEQLGLDLGPHARGGRVSVRLIDAGEVSPGEFAHDIMRTVDEGATVVAIDSLTGYYHAMPDEDMLVMQMHELLINLSQRGVLSLLTVAQHGVIGTGLHGPNISYLADNMILLRHFEAAGVLRKAMSVVKRRYGQQEPGIREIHFGREGIRVGEPLDEFQGILSGAPRFEGDPAALMREGEGQE